MAAVSGVAGNGRGRNGRLFFRRIVRLMADGAVHQNHRARYDAITERNLEALRRLQSLQAKSAWAKWYQPMHPRDLSAGLLNAFRVGVWYNNEGKLHSDDWQRLVRSTMSSALTEKPDERAARASERAIYEIRRLNGLIDPERRRRYNELGPDPELSTEEHAEIEGILKTWLRDALREFGSDNGGGAEV